MSIAALQALVLTLTEQKATMEFTRMLLDNRRQRLASERSDVYTELMNALQNDKDEDDNVTIKNSKQFQDEYNAMVAKLEAQDKMLEIERSNLSTQIEMVTTTLESAEKQLGKNVENDFKGDK